jgi:2-polyprenyl-3-methyl-5-hydroxy-6-metoxy-1,4-benzoquinol methylase
VLDWLRQFPAETKILDIGCADGSLGYHLHRSREYLTGIEPDRSWAHSAEAHYGAIINAPLSDVDDDVISDFDVVVLLDVLEHMPDPWRQLDRLSRALPRHGYVIISVPNVAHAYVRLRLLLGHFDYTERGILDRTHLRFFESHSLRQILLDSGLVIERNTATPVPLPILHRLFAETSLGRLCHRLGARLARAWPSLFGYQFVILARPGRRPRAK